MHERAVAGRRRGERDHPRRQDADRGEHRGPGARAVRPQRRHRARSRLSGCVKHQDPQGDDAVDEEEEDFEDEEDAEEAQADCTPAKALYAPREVVVSSDGRGVFAVGGDSLAAFRRDPASGELTQTGCAEAELSYKSCSETRNLFEPGRDRGVVRRALALRDQTSENAVAVFAASVAIQSRAASVDRRGRFSVRLACPAARVKGCAGRLRVGATSGRTYRVRAGAQPRGEGAARQAAAARRPEARARASDGRRARLARPHPRHHAAGLGPPRPLGKDRHRVRLRVGRADVVGEDVDREPVEEERGTGARRLLRLGKRPAARRDVLEAAGEIGRSSPGPPRARRRANSERDGERSQPSNHSFQTGS